MFDLLSKEIQNKISKGKYDLDYQIKICILWDLVNPDKNRKTYFRALSEYSSL